MNNWNSIDPEAFFQMRDFHIHDKECIGWFYNYPNNSLELHLADETSKKKYKVVFIDVLAYNTLLCELWGPSPYILNWQLVPQDNMILMDAVLKKMEFVDGFVSRYSDKNEYKEITVLFTSGDTIRVLCRDVALQ